MRAAQAGTSLQAYALDVLAGEAVKATLAERATRLERETRAELSTADLLDAMENRRERR